MRTQSRILMNLRTPESLNLTALSALFGLIKINID